MLTEDVFHHQLVSRRSFILGCFKIGMFSTLTMRMIYLQLIKGDEYQKLSDKNRIALIMISPIRGKIFDKNNNILADNVRSFALRLNKSETKDYVTSIHYLSKILNLSDDDVDLIQKNIKKAKNKSNIILIPSLSWNEVSLVEENITQLQGLYVDESYRRRYSSIACAHVTGYIGKLNEIEQERLDIKEIPDFKIGKTGVEKQYEETLQGTFGYKKMEIDATGIYVNEIDRSDSVAGGDILLNIDLELQNAIAEFLPNTGGSAAVMDIHSGKVIAFVSSPSFDPNKFTSYGGIPADYWKMLNDDSHRPLINKIIQSQYPPGSVFKLITTLAALNAGMSAAQKFECSGSLLVGDRHFHCANRGGHGLIDMRSAIAQSCNPYMYQIAKQIGSDAIINMAKRFGLGIKTEIDIVNEFPGFVPDRAWKLRRFNFDWSIGDTMNLSIGQGALLVTTLQIARMTAAIANDGFLVTPKICGISDKHSIYDKIEDLAFIREAMYDVVNKPYGSAYGSQCSQLSGKTGTAQVYSKKHKDEDLSSMNIAWEKRNHGIFTGFFPFKDPKYSLCVLVDHSGGGARVAAPVARMICNRVLGSVDLSI